MRILTSGFIGKNVEIEITDETGYSAPLIVSGKLIAATYSIKQNRETFAIEGLKENYQIDHRYSQGTVRILEDG